MADNLQGLTKASLHYGARTLKALVQMAARTATLSAANQRFSRKVILTE